MQVRYIPCQECSHEFEVEISDDGMVAFADGYVPTDETLGSFIWEIDHVSSSGNYECEATLIVGRQA